MNDPNHRFLSIGETCDCTKDLQFIQDTLVETQKLIKEFDNVDHTGNNTPTPEQINTGMAAVRKAKELRDIIDNNDDQYLYMEADPIWDQEYHPDFCDEACDGYPCGE